MHNHSTYITVKCQSTNATRQIYPIFAGTPIINDVNLDYNKIFEIITIIGALYYSILYIFNIDHAVIIQNRYINIIFNLIILISGIISLIGYIYIKNIVINLLLYCIIRIIIEFIFYIINFIA